MASKRADWIFHRDRWVRWEEATVHVTAHALHYGSSAFEGIRAYHTSGGPAIFRLDAHIRRLFDTCKLLSMKMGDLTRDSVEQLCVEAVSRNGFDSCYIRPIVYRGAGGLGLYPLECPVELSIFAVEWGRYLGVEGIEKGVDAMVSSWRRFNASTSMPLGKIGGQYTTSQLVSIEARAAGFAEGIMLDADGNVCEGAGENLFLVKDGMLMTPPMAASILGGITRDSVLKIAEDLGVRLEACKISRDMLYLADELFMCGTAAEITPVRSVDRIPVGSGARGEVTKAIQDRFFGIVSGELDDTHGWLTAVPALEPASRAWPASTNAES
ncbi:MAG TPA: branched-chain amino acid transaminase [Thermoanaerobaculia bacterium]|nr:branched-chain amino acid transaminase [Thermoanaerobaculia bacterium]